jgi:hypothetical protein
LINCLRNGHSLEKEEEKEEEDVDTAGGIICG